ncbi:acetyl-CoA carboxylase biotin carboxyl carrier protein [Marinilactibacillus psychrotolerans]|uniref:acetyl-CoA carboxylase biotin carboxyl carrier protein n=1 Tax=Marinilactibacillus psychrotolerans TaxID=191770 RepID=UPI0039AEC955
MNFDQIKELIEKIDASSLKIFELDNDLVSIKMSKNDSTTISAQTETPERISNSTQAGNFVSSERNAVDSEVDEQVQVAETLENIHEIGAPIVGTSYLASSPEKPPFVKAGDRVEKGQPLVIIEAMKVMNEIKSDVSGTVHKVLVEDGQPIEFGQPLIQITDVE